MNSREQVLVDEIDNKAEKVIRIVQITDTHLNADSSALMLGLDTNESFCDVVTLVREQQDEIDCLLCTGDLSQDASVAAYQYFEEVIASFSVPHLWLSGNHDKLENIKEAVGDDNPCLSKLHIIGNWQIIMLDSSVPGHTHGRLNDAELEFLDAALASSDKEGLNVLICIHHNPVPVRSRWLQNICLKNSEELFSVTDKYSHVKGLVFGHIHQDLNAERNGVLMLASPSTCIQFHPTSDEFALDDINPGYRWLELSSNGKIKTGVERVKDKHYNIDFSSSGY